MQWKFIENWRFFNMMLKNGQVAMKIRDNIIPSFESQVCIDVSGSIREKRQLCLTHIRSPGVHNDVFGLGRCARPH